MEKRSKKLVKNTAILSFGKICTRGIMFIMAPLFTRWLSKESYGTFDLIVTYITLLIPIITLDLGEAVFRYLVEVDKEDEKKSIISNAVIISTIGFILSILVVAIVSMFSEQIRNIAVYFVVLLLLETTNEFMIMVLRGLKKLSAYTAASIINVITMVIMVTLLIKIMNFGLSGMIIGYSIGYFISIVFMIIKSKVIQNISLKYYDKIIAKKMLRYSLPMIPNTISWWIVNASDRTIVSTILGTSTNAVLAVAHKIPNLCQTIFSVFHLSWQENAIETIKDKDRDQYYSEIMNKMTVILVSICVVILSLNFIIFRVIFSQEYFEAYYQVPILILAIIISMLAQFIGGIYIARKESKSNGKTTVVAATTNIIVNLGLINYIGLYASTVSTLVAYTVLFIIRFIDINKKMSLKFEKRIFISVIALAYIITMIYIDNPIMNIVNVFLATGYFCIVNKNYIKKAMKKIIK